MALSHKDYALVIYESGEFFSNISRSLLAYGWRCHGAEGMEQAESYLNSPNCFLLIIQTDTAVQALAWLDRLNQSWPHRRAVVYAATADIDTAVEAMKKGALDFHASLKTNGELAQATETVWREHCRKVPRNPIPLTKAELRVASLLLQGLSNKEIAHRLSRSVRTVEDHRASIMRKFEVDNVVDFVKVALAMGLDEKGGAQWHTA